jgi:hypothetical protein
MLRALSIVLLCAACDGELSAGRDVEASDPDAGTTDPRDAFVETPLTLPVPQTAALPLSESDVLRLGPGLELDVTSSFAVREDGIAIVFDTFDRSFTVGELWSASSSDGTRFTLARPMGFTRSEPLPRARRALLRRRR